LENACDIQLRETLYKNFSNLQDMIKFAEAKNTAIIASAGAIITLVFDKLCFSGLLQKIFSLGYFFIVVSLFIAFWSFVPITHPNKLKKKNNNTKNEACKNLFLFTDIASFTNFAEFESDIIKTYYDGQKLSKLERDVLQQVYTNANIACRKFSIFRQALYFFLIGATLIAVFGPFK